ncbi:HlyD family efflux transporter periplasmic adaptor subunit [Aliterella atlantica]|uniref:Hemolysin D n=1 Tax=Aliterella atlantica CENA595 TaxID=1618023 RepID=A0A0D8ZT92_9CYAN|nr:HlyD family efflux transporter periplasmic adaptor subunit [Aliterella atlantica]KJH71674.1 hemolysin D [Aliterella atlantica CENA595]
MNLNNGNGTKNALTNNTQENVKPQNLSPAAFDQPVILQQSPLWSRWILWLLMGVTTAAVVWASVAKIEEAIPATGKLEPTGTVKEVQAPVSGVVKAIHVSDGQIVRKGQTLVSLDSTAAKSQKASLQKIRTSLTQENQFYTAQLNGNREIAFLPTQVRQQIPPEIISLTKSRATLVAENQLYRAGLDETASSRLDSQQIERLQSDAAELNSRTQAANSEVEQSKALLNQNDVRLASARKKLAMNQAILKDLSPLAKTGAISKIQYLKQQQEVETAQADADALIQEQARLKSEISAGNSKLQNIQTLNRKELLTQIAQNNQRIAEIDSQLTKAMVDNNNRIAEIDSQIDAAELTLQYEEIKAPANGTVFDLQAHTPGYVTNNSQPLLKIVPNEALIAKVFITNQDIGFVKEGMNVDVRIDSFPFSEFGDIKGKLVWIGSDALPPDQVHNFYRFPAKVELASQSLLVNGRAVPLQSGMSVNGNIKVRDRTVMSIFTDLFTKSVESLQNIR